ncbi:AraC family transcriptional regulator ligand-binding domain-containing protein [Marinobacter lipolyticus]|uniref:AraC family transcriptional regulator n=1 Tax=Marinobacter lipolyticus TaxID=209639 RepID=UPI003A9158C1
MNQITPANPTALASIPTSYTRLIAQELGMQARNLPELLCGTHLTVEQLLDEATRLTAQQQIQIIENALRLSEDDRLGLRIGRRLTPAVHGPMGYLVSSSPDLLAAIEAFQAFLPTRVSFVRMDLSQSNGHLIIRFNLNAKMSPEGSRFMAEICALAMVSCAEFIIGRPARELETCFVHPDPGPDAGYADHIPGRFSFSRDELLLRVPMELCRIPNVLANHESYALAREQCEAILANLSGEPDSCQRQIETMMLSLPIGALTEEDAAAALFISKRTLSRRLKQEGVGFRQIRDEILARQARSYLRDGRLSVEAIATLLNYHDSASFRRAFKRWSGMTPDRYRQVEDL